MWGVFYAYSMVQIKTAEKSNICELVTEVTITFSYQFNNPRIKMRKVHNYVCEQIWKIFIEIYEKNFFLQIIFNVHCIWNEMEELHSDKLDIINYFYSLG
jgi:hypothetical protein